MLYMINTYVYMYRYDGIYLIMGFPSQKDQAWPGMARPSLAKPGEEQPGAAKPGIA